jgi:cysteinyl-tRNA synthetase
MHRTYVTLDVVKRIMRGMFGYNIIIIQARLQIVSTPTARLYAVFCISAIQNITDVDDKIIVRSKERCIPFRQLAQTYETEFFEDMTSLNVCTSACQRVQGLMHLHQVELPDVITRVGGQVSLIVSFDMVFCR